jgi:hypothetical protein
LEIDFLQQSDVVNPAPKMQKEDGNETGPPPSSAEVRPLRKHIPS